MDRDASHVELVAWALSLLPDPDLDVVPVGGYEVVRLEDTVGRTWFAKAVTTVNEFDAEIHAYRHWAPGLSGTTPRLVARDRSRRWLLLTSVGAPVASPRWLSHDVHRGAGQFLRDLHDQPTAGARSVAMTYRRGRDAVAGLDGLLGPEDVAFVLDCIDRLDRLPTPRHVACHGDFAPWNWHDSSGDRIGVVDFGHAGTAPAAADLVRLYVDSWWGRPDLVRSFLTGYGRGLDRDEKSWLRLSAPPTLARDLRHVLARARGDAVVDQKLHKLRALYDGRMPAIPGPLPRLRATP